MNILSDPIPNLTKRPDLGIFPLSENELEPPLIPLPERIWVIMRKQIPIKKHLLFCTGNKCLGKGGEDLKILAQNICDQSPDLSGLLVSKMGCLKQCESGPMVVLYPEGYWYSDMTSSSTLKLLRQIQEKKQLLPENLYFELKSSDNSL